MALLMPTALALSVELGEDTVVNQTLQQAADAGALDGARYLGVTCAKALTQAANGVSTNYSGATSAVTVGNWTSRTFTPSTCASTFDAVKVTATSSVKHLSQSGSISLSRSAIAAVTPPNAGFSIGTTLASLNSDSSSVLNPLLSALGTSVDINLVGYQGLASTNVSIQQLIDASGGVLTPTNVLNTSVSAAQWDSFLSTAVASQAASLTCTGASPPAACAANTAFGLGPIGNGSLDYSLCQMVSINGSTCSTTLAQSALSADVNVLQTLTTEAEVANGINDLDIGVALGGLTTLKLTIGQIPQVAYGPIGTEASTGQINATITVAGIVSIGVTGATGTAKFTGDTCTSNSMTTELTTNTSVATIVATVLILPITTTVPGVTNDVLSFPQPPPPTTQTVGSTNPSIGGLGGLTAGVLNPVLQALGISVANAAITDLSASCSPVELVQ
jgi:uncharacterized membrane protein